MVSPQVKIFARYWSSRCQESIELKQNKNQIPPVNYLYSFTSQSKTSYKRTFVHVPLTKAMQEEQGQTRNDKGLLSCKLNQPPKSFLDWTEMINWSSNLLNRGKVNLFYRGKKVNIFIVSLIPLDTMRLTLKN